MQKDKAVSFSTSMLIEVGSASQCTMGPGGYFTEVMRPTASMPGR